MKNIIINSTLLLGILFLASGCAIKKQGKWLDEHSHILSRAAASSSMSSEQKFDALANSYVKMMHQTLNFTNPQKGAAYAQTYSKQNGENIETILKSLKGMKSEMGPLESVAFGVKLLRKPYFSDLIELFPRFQRKFKTYSAIAALSGKVRNGLIDLGGSKLKDLGK